MEYFVQYHIYGKYGFPGSPASDDERLSEATHVITSSKDYFLKESKSNIVFLILGIVVEKNKRKEYYLWSKTRIRDFEGDEAWGKQDYMDPIPCLNQEPGFWDFLKSLGHGGTGLMKVTTWPFTENLINLSEQYICPNPKQTTRGEHINKFK
jgi:hypothetical protein